MITIFLAENCPWCLLTKLNSNMEELGKNLGEWAWVGRVDEYNVDEAIKTRQILNFIKNERFDMENMI